MQHFMQLAHPRHMDINIQNSKHKGQNTEVTSFEHRTQNNCLQNTVAYIGFRSTRVAMFECSPFRYNNPILYRTLLPSNTATSCSFIRRNTCVATNAGTAAQILT